MVWQFIDVFKKIAGHGVEDDDFADRLSRRQTIVLLIIFCILVGSSQFVGNPISCWVPAQFSGAMTSYTNSICWIANTYYVPTDSSLPRPNEKREFRINYYQWVPFILTSMALLFYVPFAIWRLMSKENGVQTKSVMKMISSMDQADPMAREKGINSVCKIIDHSIQINRDWSDGSCFAQLRAKMPWHRSSGVYLCYLYIFVKILYISNVTIQLLTLNYFLNSKYGIFGYEFLNDLWSGKNFWESSRFPRVTMCDFTIRTLGENTQRNTVQCTLPINLFNEKIFIFIWFWFCLVLVLSVYSCLVWFFNFTKSSRRQFVRRYLKKSEQKKSTEFRKDMLDAFVFEYLRADGLFLLRIVKKNSNDLVVSDLIASLWEQYKRSVKFIKRNDYLSTELGVDNENNKSKSNNSNESPLLKKNGYIYNP